MSPPASEVVQRDAPQCALPVPGREAQAGPHAGRRPCAGEPRTGGLEVSVQSLPRLGLFEGDNPIASMKMLKEPRQRLRFLELEEEDRLLAECAEPLRTIVLVGTNGGFRLKSEALTLRWADVDVGRRTLTVAAAYAKSGTSRTMSLNSVVLAALSRLPRISEFVSEFVFAKRNGKPYHAIRAFRAACQRAGLTGVTPHTTRHTFATRLVETRVDLRTVQELGGWATLSLVQRYALISPSRKAEAVERLVRDSTTLFTTTETRRIGKPPKCLKNMTWRGDGVAERASLENWRPRKGSASSNLAPSAISSGIIRGI